MKYVFIGIVVVLVIAGIWLVFSRSAIAPEPVATLSPSALVGGDRDAHGCIGSAGYTWCPKQATCLRIWEENCYSEPAEQVQFLLATKYEKPMTDVSVSVRASDATHLAGGVSFKAAGLSQPGAGGLFLAASKNGVWQVVYDGNGAVDCVSMRAVFGFTDALLTGFCD